LIYRLIVSTLFIKFVTPVNQ